MSRRAVVAAGLMVLGLAWPVQAQQGQPESGSRAVWNATSPGALAQRSPGNMVSAGAARHVDAQNRAFSRPEITATESIKPVQQLKIDAIRILFENLNAVLLALDNAIRAQAGFAPYVPNPIRPGGTGGIDLGSVLGGSGG